MGVEHGNRLGEEMDRQQVNEWFSRVFGIPIQWAFQMEKMRGDIGAYWRGFFTYMVVEQGFFPSDPPPGTPQQTDQYYPETPAPPMKNALPRVYFPTKHTKKESKTGKITTSVKTAT